MSILGWSKLFEERKPIEDIPGKIKKIERLHWIGMLITIPIALLGLAIVLAAPAHNIRLMLLGLFIAVDGAIMWAIAKIYVHIRLAMYQVVWQMQQQHN